MVVRRAGLAEERLVFLLVWWCVSLRDLLCAAAAAVVDSGRRVFGMVLRELVLCGCREEDVCKV